MGTVLRVRCRPSADDPGTLALEEAGIRVLAAHSTKEALARLESTEVHLVLTDATLAGGDAGGLCRAVRAHPKGNDVPILVLAPTTHGDDAHAALLDAGAHAVLAEPVAARVLVAAVRSLLGVGEILHRRFDALREREAGVTAAFDLPILGVTELSTATRRFVRVNERFCAMTGYSREELLSGMTVADVTHPDDRADDEARLATFLGGSGDYETEKRHRRKDGGVRWVHVSAALVREPDGRVERAVAAVLDITASKTAEHALAESRDRLELAQRAAGIGVFDWDVATGRVVWSEALERLYGLAPGTFGGTFAAFAALVLPDDLPRVRATLDEAVAARSSEARFGFRIVRADGDVRHVEGSARLVYDAAGTLLRVVGINLDVTARRQAEAEREALLRDAQQARAGAERANRAKDEFLAMLGHELRNPLAAVHGAVLTASLDPDRAARALDIARRQAEQLSRIVDDLLDVARITQGRVVLRRERVDLRRLADRAVEAVRALIESRHHALALHSPRDPVEVDVDPGRLEQVIANLVGNAAKFTEPGGKIQVSVAHEGADAVLRVRDTGIGISGELLPRVFELFAQGDRTLDRMHGGLGIGLTVARRLVELHGGRIGAHSSGAGLGAEFVVHLPGASTALAAQPSAREAWAPGRRRVLVVEDNLDAAESMQMLLELLGHDVRVAYDGVAAVDVAQTERPDLMLVDIGLPGIDGYEVARRIRRQPAFANVRLVAVTGYGREEDRRRALTAGFDDHLVKPVDLDVLKTALARSDAMTAEDERGRTPAAS